MLKFILILIFIVHLCSVIAQSNVQKQNRRSAKDLPVLQDLDTFLNPIESLTYYLANNITDVELNFVLGIFLTNVHFRHVLLDKDRNIPEKILSRINAIIDANEQILLYFHKAAKNDTDFMERDHVIISSLFVNSTYWAVRLKKMKYELPPTYSYSYLEVKYSKWSIYKENVDNVYNWTPNPKNSDECFVMLAINPNFKENSTSWCPLGNSCYNILTKGSNFGYALCHRLLLILFAQLGRGCNLLEGLEDERLKDEFCGKTYAESEYIAINNYGLADLMTENMCFCALDGRLQFLRRQWLHKMFDFQNKNGCFGQPNSPMVHRAIARTMRAGCNSHFTSLAAATYAAGVRFILEEYY